MGKCISLSGFLLALISVLPVAKGLKCYYCAHDSIDGVPIRGSDDVSCSLGNTPHSKYLRECGENIDGGSLASNEGYVWGCLTISAYGDYLGEVLLSTSRGCVGYNRNLTEGCKKQYLDDWEAQNEDDPLSQVVSGFGRGLEWDTKVEACYCTGEICNGGGSVPSATISFMVFVACLALDFVGNRLMA